MVRGRQECSNSEDATLGEWRCKGYVWSWIRESKSSALRVTVSSFRAESDPNRGMAIQLSYTKILHHLVCYLTSLRVLLSLKRKTPKP
eukprot:1195633-Prorocentrum_minimum.AAC.2